jgi:hypothetical protein
MDMHSGSQRDMRNHRPFLTVKSPHYDVVKAANPHIGRTNRLCRLGIYIPLDAE